MRQFISEVFPDKNGILKLEEKDFHYLKQVLRVKTGDMINIRLPDSSLKGFTVCKIQENKKTLILQECASKISEENSLTRGTQASELEQNALSTTEFWLFTFISKPSKMELIIRQAVECGIKFIIPVISEYSQKSSVEAIKNAKKERLLKIVKESRQQSGSPVETKILEPISVEDAANMWKEQNSPGVLLWEQNKDSKSLHEIFKSADTKKAAVLVGCEGGISPNEFEILKKSNFIPVHFDINILRCETASLYGIAAVQSVILEKSKWQCTE